MTTLSLTTAAAPDFSLPFISANETGDVTLSSLRPAPVVLFFYPRDNTSGCTVEAIDFTSLRPKFDTSGAKVFGISTDSLKKHENFISKHALGIPLICDEAAKTCQDYGVWREKSMYGKKFWGIERSTFLISGAGVVLREWRKVKVPNHAQEVLDFLLSEEKA